MYRYSFDRKIPVPADHKVNGVPATSRDIGARHAGEIEYVFGALDLSLPNVPWEASDRKLSNAMTTYWSNFARTGDPNGNGLPKWPRFDARPAASCTSTSRSLKRRNHTRALRSARRVRDQDEGSLTVCRSWPISRKVVPSSMGQAPTGSSYIDIYSRYLYHVQARQSARLARIAGDENPPARPQPWLRDFVSHPADVGRRAAPGGWVAVSGAASDDRSRPAQAEWRVSEAGRRARFYALTAKGRRKLEADQKRWHDVSTAVAKILRTT